MFAQGVYTWVDLRYTENNFGLILQKLLLNKFFFLSIGITQLVDMRLFRHKQCL